MTTDKPDQGDRVERLRAELLVSGLSDWVSLGEVQQIISAFRLAGSDEDRRTLVTATIGSLLREGLTELGELPAPGDPFLAWTPVANALDRLRERFVEHYDEPETWDYSIWLNLTELGRQVAEA